MSVRSGLIQFLLAISLRWRPLRLGLALGCVSLLLLAPAAQAGILDLSWNAPTTNSDGTPLTDLSGYRVYWGITAGNSNPPCNTNSTSIGNVTAYQLTGLTDGTIYFVQVTALDTSGNESACSNEDSAAAVPAPLSITTTSLPSATVGTAYSQTLTATGGTTPYTWSLSSGTLPPGITRSGAVLSGTPTTVGTFAFTVQVTDSASATDTQALSLSVNATPPPPPASSAAAGGGCFIATAAYGSALEPQVVLLRAFRDRYLLTNSPGRAFVQWYYRTSPPVAELIRQSPMLRGLVRVALWPLVGVAWLTLHPGVGATVLGGMGGLAGWRRSRRKTSPRAPA